MRRLLFISMLLFLSTQLLVAQEDFPQEEVNVDDLGNVSDTFKESFFEALKQKGIENYGRAIEALEICVKSQPNNAVLHFEFGKNYNALKQYDSAEASLKKALSLKANDEDILKELYDVQFNKKDYQSAAETVQKLIVFDLIYKEDLAKLYQRTRDYDKALQELDELDDAQGASTYRDNLRRVIYRQSDNKQAQANVLERRIKTNPNNPQNYLNLIYIYSEMNNNSLAFSTAQKLLKAQPDLDLAHMALYKGYLEKGQVNEAIASMKIVLKSNQIDKETKGKVLKDFMQYSTENPEVSNELETVLDDADNDKDPKDLALFYLEQKDNAKALQFFAEALEEYPTDYDVLKNLALLQIDAQQFSNAVATTTKGLDVYPSQPLLYLLQGVAHNNTSAFKNALESLEFGIDYIIDDSKMEADFFTQMSVAFTGLGNNSKATEFQQRAIKASKQSN